MASTKELAGMYSHYREFQDLLSKRYGYSIGDNLQEAMLRSYTESLFNELGSSLEKAEVCWCVGDE